MTQKPWYKKWWAIALFIFFSIGIIANSNGTPDNSNTETTKKMQKLEEVVVVFDLEALYGKNVEEIKTALGKTKYWQYDEDNRRLDYGQKEWSVTFEKDEYELLVTYDVQSKSVIDFFLPTDDPSGATKETVKLEQMLNVQNSNNFIIEPVKALKDASLYTGIKVIPKK